MDRYQRAIDQIDGLGEQGWRDRNSEGLVRNILLGLRVQGLLDPTALEAVLRDRGYDDEALRRLKALTRETFDEPK